jgi:hypothetical protein
MRGADTCRHFMACQHLLGSALHLPGHMAYLSALRNCRARYCRGTVTIAPSNVFTLFTNSTEQQYADAHLRADQVCSYSFLLPSPQLLQALVALVTLAAFRPAPAIRALAAHRQVSRAAALRGCVQDALNVSAGCLQVPAKLRNMALRQFAAYQQPSRLRRRLKNMYYTSEHYYYSGQPPPTLGHRPEEPPLSCLTQPSSALPCTLTCQQVPTECAATHSAAAQGVKAGGREAQRLTRTRHQWQAAQLLID